MNKTTEEHAEEIWDFHSQQIGESIDDAQYWSGKIVMTYPEFEKAAKIIAQSIQSENEKLREALEKIAEDKYPEKVFKPFSPDEWDGMIKLLRDNGYNIDQISGTYGRIFHEMHRSIATKALQP